MILIFTVTIFVLRWRWYIQCCLHCRPHFLSLSLSLFSCLFIVVIILSSALTNDQQVLWHHWQHHQHQEHPPRPPLFILRSHPPRLPLFLLRIHLPWHPPRRSFRLEMYAWFRMITTASTAWSHRVWNRGVKDDYCGQDSDWQGDLKCIGVTALAKCK